MVTQNMLRTFEGKYDFSEEKKIRFMTALDLNECLIQIKEPRSIHMCAPISVLPSNVSSKYHTSIIDLM